MNSVAVPVSSTDFKKTEAIDKFARANLSVDDASAVMSILQRFYESRAKIQTDFEYLHQISAKEEDFRTLHARYVSQLDATKQELLTTLTVEGTVKLQRHVSQLKDKIKILPAPK